MPSVDIEGVFGILGTIRSLSNSLFVDSQSTLRVFDGAVDYTVDRDFLGERITATFDRLSSSRYLPTTLHTRGDSFTNHRSSVNPCLLVIINSSLLYLGILQVF